MVTRTSTESQFGQAGNAQVQQSGIGQANVDVNKYSTGRVQQQVSSSTSSAADRILGSLVTAAQPVAEMMVKQGREEAYLRGSAAAGTGESEASLQSNFLTRDWATAGYRDTMGKLANADMESNIAQAMKTMRDKSPEEFNAYLSEQRAAMLPQLEGMSQEARKAMFAQTLMSERAAIKKHGAEHAAFIMETQTQVYKNGWASKLKQLTYSKQVSADGDPVAIHAASTDAALSYMYGAFTDPRLTPAIKGQMLGQMLTSALQEGEDNQLLYNKMQNTSVRWPDGSSHPMTDAMSWEDNVAAGKAYQSSLERTEYMRTREAGNQLAQYKAAFSTPGSPVPARSEFFKFVDNLEQNFPKTLGKERDSLKQQYYTAEAREHVGTQLATMASQGNFGGIAALGKSTGEALSALQSSPRFRALPYDVKVGELMQMAMLGMPEANGAIGGMFAPTVVQMMVSDEINPELAKTFSGTINAFDKAEAGGHQGMFQQMVQTLTPDQQAFVMDVRALSGSGQFKGNPSDAIRQARKIALDTAKMPDVNRKALANENAKADAEQLATLTPVGIWGAAKEFIPFTSNQAGSALTVRDKWFEQTEVAENAMMQAKKEVQMVQIRLAHERPLSSASTRFTMAVAEVSGRTIHVPGAGPIILPPYTDLAKWAGVTGDVQKDRVGIAIGQLLKVEGNERISFSIGGQNELLTRITDKNGTVLPNRTINSKDIGAQVAENSKKLADEARVYRGEGVRDKASGVAYNGENTAGVDAKMVYNIRKDLLQHEGYTAKPMNDVGGQINKKTGKVVQTVGPGLSDTNEHYPKAGPDGTISQQAMSDSFMRASNDAVKQAKGALTQYQLFAGGSGPAMRLVTGLAYQSGPAFNSFPAVKQMLQGMRDANPDRALSALRETNAYKGAGATRRTFYEQQLKESFK